MQHSRMPSDGRNQQQQQVYGAKHPPFYNNNSSSSTAAPSTTGASSSSLHQYQQQQHSTAQDFKDFEKKTLDVWDLDDNDADDFYKFPISIKDSEEMVEKVIKNHKEQSEKSLYSPKRTPPSSSLAPSSKGGPGKALRQDSMPHIDLNRPTNLATATTSKTTKNAILSPNSASGQQTTAEARPPSGSSTKHSPTMIQQPQVPPLSAQQDTSSCISSALSQNNKYTYPHVSSYRDNDEDSAKIEKFKQILSRNPINLEELQNASWRGIPKQYRATCWKLLSDYLPLKQELQDKTIEQKRNAYWESVNEHYSSGYLESHQETLIQILKDIPRMNPLIPIFQKKTVQDIFQRALYVWAVRHPASGYVQGINDLMTPFFTVFLTEYTDTSVDIQNVDIDRFSEKDLRQIEADSYWCMTKLLDRIQENYVFSQPGIQKNVQALEDLIKRIDRPLYNHLIKNHIEFIQFAFRWMNNLLMREIPLHCTIRLWDTYHAEPFGFSDFHLYVCAAFLQRFSKSLMEEKDFQGLMLLLQSLPTKNWKVNDMTLLTAEAYTLQVMFANSPSHTAQQ